MTFLAFTLFHVGRGLEYVSHLLFSLGKLFHGFLPALLNPWQMNRLLNRYYSGCYYSDDWRAEEHLLDGVGYELATWETALSTRYGIASGRMIVLGCGWGRESIRFAERHVEVVGLDRHEGVLRAAKRAAKEHKVRADFLRGDFLSLPHLPGSFDYALLSGTMYSAIPSIRQRQAWLRNIQQILKPGGLLILSFQVSPRIPGRIERLSRGMNRWLLKLPGTNVDYQAGDTCHSGHFFHLFRDKEEIRKELEGAGADVREIDWPQQYAVVSYAAGH